jgi:hypothetical protein
MTRSLLAFALGLCAAGACSSKPFAPSGGAEAAAPAELGEAGVLPPATEPSVTAPDAGPDAASVAGIDARAGDAVVAAADVGAEAGPDVAGDLPAADATSPADRAADLAVAPDVAADASAAPDLAEAGPDAELESGVHNTIPFTGGVYVLGTTSGHVEGGESLQRFWPTRSRERYTGFHRDVTSGFRFRPTDGQLFYLALGIRIDDSPTKVDTQVLTPPCGDLVGDFGFDAEGTLHYVCDGVVRRGNGERVAPIKGPGAGYDHLAGILGDGRVVLAHDSYPRHYEVMSTDGQVLSRFEPEQTFFGSAELVPWATTVNGNDAFVIYLRKFYNSEVEDLVVMRIDERSRFLFVRRLPRGKEDGKSLKVLSDGTIFRIHGVDLPNGDHVGQITAYMPDGTERVAWRDTDGIVKFWVFHGMFAGPLTPSGPSLQTE